jgi:hypothetical protein
MAPFHNAFSRNWESGFKVHCPKESFETRVVAQWTEGGSKVDIKNPMFPFIDRLIVPIKTFINFSQGKVNQRKRDGRYICLFRKSLQFSEQAFPPSVWPAFM